MIAYMKSVCQARNSRDCYVRQWSSVCWCWLQEVFSNLWVQPRDEQPCVPSVEWTGWKGGTHRQEADAEVQLKMLMNRQLRMRLPIAPARSTQAAAAPISKAWQMQKCYYDVGSKSLPLLAGNYHVRVRHWAWLRWGYWRYRNLIDWTDGPERPGSWRKLVFALTWWLLRMVRHWRGTGGTFFARRRSLRQIHSGTLCQIRVKFGWICPMMCPTLMRWHCRCGVRQCTSWRCATACAGG